jgi:hypothetical protein
VLSGLPLGLVFERRGEAAREATCERMFRASVLAERWPYGESDGRPELELYECWRLIEGGVMVDGVRGDFFMAAVYL